MKNPPKKIYLQVDTEKMMPSTWCEDRVTELDIEYVLASDCKKSNESI